MKSSRKFYYLLFTIIIILSCSKDEKTIHKKSNDLINETSPYLLQHAYNPVNWKAWNKETLQLAKKEDKLIVISVGYSACHWCHVMEEESFENDSIAMIMNDNFINIKVDREERPDVDQVYMNAVQLMTGSGGWPLNCIALPDGRPIFGGTYFTKEQWAKILKDISKLYKENPDKAIAFAENLTKGIQESQLIKLNKEKSNFLENDIVSSVNLWKQKLDTVNGGFIGTPKFPTPSSLEFLMRYSYQFEDESINKYTKTTLQKIAFGGIYDHIGGGFSRYSVDEKWHIPHFEKMLYDNAQLVSLYSKAFAKSKNELYKTTILETLNFIENELTAKNGAFFSSLDADSKNNIGEKEEGAYYSWKEDELKEILGKDYNLFKEFYNINNYGLWEKETYVLIRNSSKEVFSKQHNISLKDLNIKIEIWKKSLSFARELRSKPNLDDKVLTSWNALMIQGYIDAYKSFNDKKYLDIAIRNSNFLLKNQLKKDNGLYRNFKNNKSTINAYSEDYALVIKSFISLYEVTFDEKWLFQARNLVDYLFLHFFDIKNSMFYFTSDEDESLIARKYEIVDGVIASSNSLIANSLFKLGHYFTNNKYLKTSEQMLHNLKIDLMSNPYNYSNWLSLMINFTRPYYELVVAGENASQINNNLKNYYLPNVIIAGTNKDDSQIELLSNKFNEDETFIYVCINGTCKLPQTNIVKAIKSIRK